MLHCNMNAHLAQLALDDLLADLTHARRTGDLGRLAFLIYCEVRRWARDASESALASHASEMVITSPHASRDSFLAQVDTLICELQQVRPKFLEPLPNRNVRAVTHPMARGAPPR